MEYVALSRDTTESDLKQRREIKYGTAFYVDQCAVRAATEGRILVLEGIEKAERNVLPVLNNLLENRLGRTQTCCTDKYYSLFLKIVAIFIEFINFHSNIKIINPAKFERIVQPAC